jgi:hypothetical protein
MADEEPTSTTFQTQLEPMRSLGEPLYLAQCVARSPA